MATKLSDGETTPCKRCTSNPATLKLADGPVCDSCYARFTSYKVVRRLGAALKDLRNAAGDRSLQPRYLLGLSLGPSSTGLLHFLDENARALRSRSAFNNYDFLVVHIDTDLSSPAPQGTETPTARSLARYRERFPDVDISSVNLSEVLGCETIDWSALPMLPAPTAPTAQDEPDPRSRITRMLEALPSVTARVDVLRLLVRHLLLSVAMKRDCNALLLGNTTTAMAELILAETAKGRGYAIPWQVADGPYPVSRFGSEPGGGEVNGDEAPDASSESRLRSTFPVYYPLRDLLRRQVVLYNQSSVVSVADLTVVSGGGSGSSSNKNNGANVVSHRDLSIEDVMGRYFEETEETYPAVVINVLRTTERLTKPEGDACGLCGMTLDEQGDARWKGEIGEDSRSDEETDHPAGERLCYGCERSIRG